MNPADVQLWKKVSKEISLREREALKVYRPMRNQEEFHKSISVERILRGGKRSGKSIAAAMEFGSIVTGIPLVDMNGQEIPRRYPVSSPQNPLIYWIIGWDTKHIGQTIHKLLFQRGMGGTLRVIQDNKTGVWRTWNRANRDDYKRIKETHMAEPVIPPRLIVQESWDWESKTANQFNGVELTNGARIFAYPSSARNPKQGDAVAGIWIDEDIQFPNHLKEWQDRLTDMEGWMMWSVWPHTKNSALIDLLDRAESVREDEHPYIVSIQLIMSENEYLTDIGKRQSLARMESPDEIARRDRGELLLDTLSMYEYIPAVHLLKKHPGKEQPNIMSSTRTVRQTLEHIWYTDGRFPREWTRYLSIDPSNTRTAVVSAVVPPQEWDGVQMGNICIVEWELVVKRYSPEMLAKALRDWMQLLHYEAFIMDQNIGRQTRVGADTTVFESYAQSFRKYGLMSRQTGSGYIPGVNVPTRRYRAVREMMVPQESGCPMLLLTDSRTIQTQREFATYRKKQLVVGGEEVILDEPANPRRHDCMAAVEYLAAHVLPLFAMGTAYVDAGQYGGIGSPAYRKAQQLLNKSKDDEGAYVHLGPGIYAA